MAGSLHGSARITPRVRAELQVSQETSITLAKRYGLSRTTVTKWRARITTNHAPMEPTAPHSTILSAAEEAMIVEFRRHTLLPLDDVLGCLRDSIPKLTRSSLHPIMQLPRCSPGDIEAGSWLMRLPCGSSSPLTTSVLPGC